MAEIVVALDVPEADAAFRLLDRLPHARWVKVGPILMTREGPEFTRRLVDRGLQVFLDLKWHDIPNTVAGAVTAAAGQGIAMATVHVLGGPQMLEAAVRAGGPDLALVGVTVLTSHDAESYRTTIGRTRVDLLDEVVRLAGIGIEAGLRGVVCSPREAGAVRRAVGPAPWLVVPGVRRRADDIGDQARAATPEEAVRQGATHLVVGRPLLLAADPAAVFEELRETAEC